MLTLSGVTYRVGGRTGRRLLDQANAQIDEGAKVGLVGRNGAGKSTLLDLIRGVLQPDDGTIELPRGRRIGFLAQEAPSGAANPLETVLAADRERTRLLAEREAGAEPLRLAEIETRLVEIKAHAAPSRAARILAGLGLDRAGPARAGRRFVGRLADARGARRDPVRRARSVAARRADQSSRPRSRAVARRLSAQLSAHPDPGQPRPPFPECRDDLDAASPPRKAHPLLGRLRRLYAGPHRGGAPPRGHGTAPGRRAAANAGLCRPLSRQGLEGAPGTEPAQGIGPARADHPLGRRTAAGDCLSRPAAAEPAADRARPGQHRLCARQAGAVAARLAARSRRPDRAARRQRQRQDDLCAAAGRPPRRRSPERSPGRRSSPAAFLRSIRSRRCGPTTRPSTISRR